MVLMRMIARVFDGLLLAASVQGDKQTGKSILEYQNLAKRLFKTLKRRISTGSFINTTSRPYTFLEFDNYLQKAKKTYSDTRGRRNLSNLNTEL